MIERLNQTFALPNSLVFVRDSNNFAKVCLTSGAAHGAEILVQGAQVSSWTGPNREELLFMSSKAVFQRGKPVRGGIPIIFPQFGKGDLPSHGFARTSMWEIKETKMLSEGEPSITFKLEDTHATRDMWAHQFVLEYTVSLSDRLRTSLKVVNCGTTPFFFYAGFHTYFRIADINRTEIRGLHEVTYMDALRTRNYGVQNADPLTIEEHTDRIYLNAPDTVRLLDRLMGREYTVTKQNIKDLVVWNPWENGSKAFADLGAHEYLSFVCVEPAIVNQKITLGPREKYECGQELSYR